MRPLPVHPRPVRLRVEGRVLDTTALEARPAWVRFEVRRAAIGKAAAPCRSAIALRFPDEAGVPRWATPGLWLSVEGTYRPPEDSRNPGTEAPGRWMERLGLEGTLDADPLGVAILANPPSSVVPVTAIVRDRMARAFDDALAPPVAALARGMILGDRSRIAPATRDDFRDGGTIHILSISGLHVCILGGFAALLALATRLGLVPGLVVELLLVWGYTLLVGAPASALRAALLWTAVRGGRALGREVRPLAAWGVAGLLLHLADPRAVHDPGFQLSFAAVLGLLAAGGIPGGDASDAGTGAVHAGVGRLGPLLRGAAAIGYQSAAAMAGTLGLSARLFGALPTAGLLLNVAVVPLCTLFMAECFFLLAASAVPVRVVPEAAGGALDAVGLLLLQANAWGARAVAPEPLRGVPGPGVLALAAVALLLGASLREGARHASRAAARRRRAASLVAVFLAGLLPFVPTRSSGERHAARRPFLAALDVGQGDATVALLDDGATVVVDAGPSDGIRDLGRLAVEPALRAEGWTRIDTAILSHAHQDHFGGFEWLLRRGWIRMVIENGSDPGASWRRDLDRHLARTSRRRVVVAPGARIGGDALLVRGPPPDSLVSARGNAVENNRSLVASLRVGGVRVHLPGDAEDEAERAACVGLEEVDVLKAPHHGSRTSSTMEWLRALRPAIVLVSAGERNRFGHPDRSTLGRYHLIGARIWRTDREGAIRVTPATGGAWVSTRAHPEPEWVPLPRNGPR